MFGINVAFLKLLERSPGSLISQGAPSRPDWGARGVFVRGLLTA